jgi:hypothetical protein
MNIDEALSDSQGLGTTPLEQLSDLIARANNAESHWVIHALTPVPEDCVELAMQQPLIEAIDFPATDVPLRLFLNMPYKVAVRIGSITDRFYDKIPQESLKNILFNAEVLLLEKETTSAIFGTLIPHATDALKHVNVTTVGSDAEADIQTIFHYAPNLACLIIAFPVPVCLSTFIEYAPISLNTLNIRSPVTDQPERGSHKIGSVELLVLNMVSGRFECNFFAATRNTFMMLLLQRSAGLNVASFLPTLYRSATKLQVLDLSLTNLLTDELLQTLVNANCNFIRVFRADRTAKGEANHPDMDTCPGFSVTALQRYLESKVSKRLEMLTLMGHAQITNDIFSLQFSCIGHLQKLDLRDTSCRSEDKIDHLRLLKNPKKRGSMKLRQRFSISSSSRESNGDPLQVYLNNRKDIDYMDDSHVTGPCQGEEQNRIPDMIDEGLGTFRGYGDNDNTIPFIDDDFDEVFPSDGGEQNQREDMDAQEADPSLDEDPKPNEGEKCSSGDPESATRGSAEDSIQVIWDYEEGLRSAVQEKYKIGLYPRTIARLRRMSSSQPPDEQSRLRKLFKRQGSKTSEPGAAALPRSHRLSSEAETSGHATAKSSLASSCTSQPDKPRVQAAKVVDPESDIGGGGGENMDDQEKTEHRK